MPLRPDLRTLPARMALLKATHPADQLNHLLDVARELGSTTRLQPLLERIEQAGRRLLACERVRVFVYDPTTNELFARLATDRQPMRFGPHEGIAGYVFQTGETVNTPDAYADPRFLRVGDEVANYKSRTLLTLPMRGSDGQPVGAIQFVNKLADGVFTARDEDLGQALGALTGVALQRQLLLRVQRDKRHLEQELAIAREIQQAFLPRTAPTVPGYDVAGWNRPAAETGGDAYDFIPLADGRLGMLLADASGHGIGPALMATSTRSMVRALLEAGQPLPSILQHVNAILHRDLTDGRYVSTCVAVLDPAAGSVTYVSGGLAPIWVYRAATQQVEMHAATSAPLGVLPVLPLVEPVRLDLAPGDRLLIASDGFAEWENARGETFGFERIEEVLRREVDTPSLLLVKRLREAARAFAGQSAGDDRTALVILRTSREPDA